MNSNTNENPEKLKDPEPAKPKAQGRQFAIESHPYTDVNIEL